MAAASSVIPGLQRAPLVLPGTPRTFHRYVRRHRGMVGGFGQRNLFSSMSPRTHYPNLFRVGDSIFPGQSTAAVSLGALRVAEIVTSERMPKHLVHGFAPDGLPATSDQARP